jgi:hypothetical protein
MSVRRPLASPRRCVARGPRHEHAPGAAIAGAKDGYDSYHIRMIRVVDDTVGRTRWEAGFQHSSSRFHGPTGGQGEIDTPQRVRSARLTSFRLVTVSSAGLCRRLATARGTASRGERSERRRLPNLLEAELANETVSWLADREKHAVDHRSRGEVAVCLPGPVLHEVRREQ